MPPDRFKLPVWALPLAIAGLVALLGWWGDRQLKATIDGGLEAQLAATLNANVTALDIWSTNQLRLATALAEDPNVRKAAKAILESPPTLQETLPAPASAEMESFVSDLRPRLARLGYGIGQLVSTNFSIAANTLRPELPGNTMVSDAHTNKFGELFATGEPVIITPFRPEMLTRRREFRDLPEQFRKNALFRQLNRRTQAAAARRRGDVTLMQVAAPVRDEQDHIIGALALIVSPEREFSHILSVARSGDTGETYAFDETGLMISDSRFDNQLKGLGLLAMTNVSSALNVRLRDPGGDLTQGFKPAENESSPQPLTRLVASAVDGEDKVDIVPSRDYRGVLVTGASRWLPQFGLGVATQIDATEAFRPLRVLQLIFVILVLFLLLCATGMFVYSHANLAWRQRVNAMELKLKQLGQYSLEEKVGEGGMGVVYRARHALMRRDTAVKLLLPGRADAAALERFEREVCLACQLTHPNTIQVYDYGHTPEGIFYYAMEFLRGVNLHDLVTRLGPQPEGRVVHILAQVCASLAEAHAVGLIHRDIKPGNIFLCRRGGTPDFVKVLDFGLVSQYNSNNGNKKAPLGTDGELLVEGTPWFMPPEAINGVVAAGPRSDIYSVGAVGYFLLTGSYLFEAATVAEIHNRQLSVMPVPPRERTPNPVNPELEAILMRCLAKDPEQRPESAEQLRALLLATSSASTWTLEDQNLWWDQYERREQAGQFKHLADAATLPTVSVDLSGRMK